MSQLLAVWPGQGSYYSVMLFAAWTFGRAVRSARRCAVVHVAVPLVMGAMLDAAALLPRVEFQSLSNLAGGYPLTELVGGWQFADFVRLVTPGGWDVGAVPVCMSVVGLATLARHPRSPFVLAALLWASSLVLASSTPTPLHTALFKVLPGFAVLHPHVSERVLIVTYFAPALLAGLGWQAILRSSRRRLVRWGIAAVATIELVVAGRMGVDIQIGAAWDAMARVDSYNAFVAATPAAQFLMAKAEQVDSPFRYLGYAPLLDGEIVPYTQRFTDSATRALLVNNRAITLGLRDVQGYNALHLARFDAYLQVVNAGRTQNYHDGQVFAPTASSPLLDLTGVRFVVVRADDPSGGYPTVFQDKDARIVEHPNALPHAWRVHTAQFATANDALQLINSGAVDPRSVVLLEAAPVDPPADYMVFNEIAYPGWVAYVDGRPSRPLAADGVLQAVAIPPGAQQVELRFESATLRDGLVVSGVALVMLTVVLIGTFQPIRVAATRRLRLWNRPR